MIDEDKSEAQKIAEEQSLIPRCPFCGSTEVYHNTNVPRSVGIALVATDGHGDVHTITEWTGVDGTFYEEEEADPKGKYYCETCGAKGNSLVTRRKRQWLKQRGGAPPLPSLVDTQGLRDTISDPDEPIDKRARIARELSMAYMAFAKVLVLTDDPRWDELDEAAKKRG